MPIDIAHKLLQALLGVEHLLLGLSFVVGTQVGQRDGDACIEECQLAHAAGNDVPLIGGGGEDGGVGPELLSRTPQFGFAHHLDGVERFALLVLLLIDFPVAENLRKHVRRQCVHTTHAHAVQTAADLVGAFVELASGMQHRHDHFEGRLVHFFVLVNGNATAVVLHGDGVVRVDGHFYMGTEACHGLVDRVVNGLVYQMVQSFFADVANIHGRTLADSLKSFEHLNVTGRIVALVFLYFCHFLLFCL